MENLKERFSAFSRPEYFSRVDTNHVLELYIGLDEKNRKAIELRYPFKPRKVSGTSAIDVCQYKRESYNTIRFSLCDEEISGLFYKFCADLIEQTRDIKDESDGYQSIVNRFYQWKKLFVSSKAAFLTEPAIMGLIGEILFLRGNLADRIGISNALRSWSGQELTHKDFSYNNMWFEAKAISRGAQSVKISSLEQLESENEGELVVHALEKMSTAYNGITLNKLVFETRELFSSTDEQDLFMSKVALQGYEYHNYYDDFVYEISSFTRYRVGEGFPRLTQKSVPAAITKATYEISLVEIMPYMINN